VALKPFSGLLDQDTPTKNATLKPFDGTLDGEESSIVRRAGDYGISALKGAIAVPEAAVGLADIVTGGEAGKVAEEVGFRPKEAKQILDSYLTPEQQAANRKVHEAEGFVDTVKESVKNPSTIAHTIVESVPSMLGGGAIARGITKVAPKVAPYVAGALGEGTVGAGSAAEQVRQQTEDGTLSVDQIAPVVASGAGTALFGAVGGRVAQKLGIGDVDTMLAKGGSGMTQKGVVRRIIEGGISEGVFEELPQSVQEQIWQNAALDKPLLEGVPESAAIGLLAGGVMGGAAAGAFNRSPDTPAAPAARPLQDAAAAAEPDQPVLGLPNYQNETMFSFPDGSSGTRAQAEAYINSFPEPERIEVRAKLYGYAPEAAAKIQEQVNKNPSLLLPNYAGETLYGFPDGSVGTRQQGEEYIASLPEDDRPAARAKLFGINPLPASATESPAKPAGPLARAAQAGGVSTTGGENADQVAGNADVAAEADEAGGDLGGGSLAAVDVQPDGTGLGDVAPEPVQGSNGNQSAVGALPADPALGEQGDLDTLLYQLDRGDLRHAAQRLRDEVDLGSVTAEEALRRVNEAAKATRDEAPQAEAVLVGDDKTIADATARELRMRIRNSELGLAEAEAMIASRAGDQQWASGEEGITAIQRRNAIRKILERSKARLTEVTKPSLAASKPGDAEAHAAATSPTNELPEPTDAQKEAGNYRKGKISIGGLNISVENPQGSVRRSKADAVDKWETTMHDHYGYIKGVPARAPDKEHVDVYVRPGTADNFAGMVYVVNQVHPDTGKFDEPKVMIGFGSQQEAETAYRSNYSADWKGMGSVTAVPMQRFKEMLNDEKAFLKPVEAIDTSESKANQEPSAAPEQAAKPVEAPAVADESRTAAAVQAAESLGKQAATALSALNGNATPTQGRPELRPLIEDLIRNKRYAEQSNIDPERALDRAKQILRGQRTPNKGDITWFRDRSITHQKAGDKANAETLRKIAEMLAQPATAEEAKKADEDEARKQFERSDRARKMIADRNKLDTDNDDLMTAIAKLGGIKRDEAISEFGFDPADLNRFRSGIKLSFTNGKNALTVDGMRESLRQYGYPVGETVRDFGDILDAAVRGGDVQTDAGIERDIQARIDAYEEQFADQPDAVHEAVDAFDDWLESSGTVMTDDDVEALFNGQDENEQAGQGSGRQDQQPAAETADGRDRDDQAAPANQAPREESQDLLGDNTASRQAVADAARAKDEKRNSGESSPEDFTLTGSDRAADQAIARGARDLFDQPAQSDTQATTESDYLAKPEELDADRIKKGYAHRVLGSLGGIVSVERDQYVKTVQSFYDDLQPIAKNEAQQEELRSLTRQLKELYREKRYRVMDVGSTVASSAVTGRSKFNSKQAGTRGNALDRAEANFSDWLKQYDKDARESILALKSPEDIAAEKQAKADKDAKNHAALIERMRSIEAFKPGETVKLGTYNIARVSRDRDGYPSSVTVDATDLTDNKFDLANTLFNGSKERLRKIVDEARATQPAVQEQPSAVMPNSLRITKADGGYAVSFSDEINEFSRYELIAYLDDAYKRKLFDGVLGKDITSDQAFKVLLDDAVNNPNAYKGILPKAVEIDAGSKQETQDDQPATQLEEAKQPSTPLSPFDNAMDEYRNGTANVDDYKAAFKYVLEHEKEITDYLDTLTKKQLFERGDYSLEARYKNEKKERVVRALYSDMVGEFLLPGETGMRSYSHSYGGDKYANIKQQVDAITQESLNKAMARRQAVIAENTAKQAEVLKGIADPQTLDDFNNLMRSQMAEGMTLAEARKTLTPEQRERYDDMAATKTRSDRGARKNEQKTEVRAAVHTTTGDIIETKHTKTGEDLFVVKAAERVERDVYNQWNTTAKRLGGWYSSFRGNGAVPGFQFKTRENAEAFLKYLGGDVDQAKEAIQTRRDEFADDRSQTAVQRLTEMADKLEERADDSLGQERKANTARRARFAASAEAAANADKALAKTMRNIAQGIDAGSVKYLDQVRQKVQVEMLQGIVRKANDELLRDRYKSYREQEEHKHERPTKDAADFVQFPSFTAYRSDLASLGRALLDTEGTKKLGQRVMSVADDVTDAYLKFSRENLDQVSRFGIQQTGERAVFTTKQDAETAIARSNFKGKAIVLPFKRGQNLIILSPSEAMNLGIWNGDNDKRITLAADLGAEIVEKLGKVNRNRNVISVPWQFENAYDKRKRLAAMGIETPAELRAAVREFIGLQEAPQAPDKIKQMERAMIGRRNDGLDFFPTPASVADEMIETAGLTEGMRVLEPSAGMGHIADQIREAGVEPDVVEFSGDRRELLQAKGYNVVGHDFMDVTDGDYDRIIMNPPFGDRRDAAHVQHAYDLLKPGGRVVAIMGEGVFFGQDKRAQDFREWLERVGGTDEKLEEGTFNDPSLPVNTGVNARMVVIDKPEDAPKFRRGLDSDLVQLAVDNIKSKWKNAPDVVVVQNMSDSRIRKAVRDENDRQLSQGATGQPEGFFDNGKVYIIASEMRSARDVQRVLFHEALGHYGLRGVFGNDLNNVLDQVYLNRRQDVLAKAKSYGLDISKASDRRIAAEEVLAELAQSHPELNFVKRAIAAIRSWLRAHGFDIEMTDDEIVRELIEPARQFVQRGEQGGIAVEMAAAFDRGDGDQTETEAFKRWFGDSKVVDAEGKPLVVYHYSDAKDIEVFRGSGLFGNAPIYFNENPKAAKKAARGKKVEYPVYLHMANPINTPETALPWHKVDDGIWVAEAKSNGYDGVYVKDEGGVSVAVFNPEQIKSAIGNNGNFDAANPSIVFSRADRTPSKAAGDTVVTAAAEYLARNPDLFKWASTDAKTMDQIGKEIDPGYTVKEMSKGAASLVRAEKGWEISIPDSARSAMIYEKGNEVWIDVQYLRPGKDSGSVVYTIAASYAHNNGKVLIGDPAGLSRAAYYRRNEAMLSSALKYGTTRHLAPHVAQEVPAEYYGGQGDAEFGKSVRPLNWIAGDDVNNIREMIYTSWKSGIDNVPELKNVIFNPDQQRFERTDGTPFDDQEFERLVSQYGAQASNPYRAGVATQKRTALFNTFLRPAGAEGGRRLLDSFVHQLQSGPGLSPPLKGIFYSRSAVPAGNQEEADPLDKYRELNRRFREEHDTVWSKGRKWLKRQLSPGGLLPKSVFDEKIRRDSEFEVIEFDIKHLVGQLERAVKRDYNIDAGELDTKTQQLLSAAMAGKVGQDVPENTKAALIGMRQYIDKLSEQYLQGLAGQINELSALAESGDGQAAADALAKIGLYETILGNVGEYVHRSFRAFDDPQWARNVPDDVLNAARDYLIARNLESMTQQAAERRAEVVLNEILKNGTAYDNMETFIKESKLGAKDLSVLKRRKEIAPEIRALMGEYTDPRINFAKSATKMGRLIWNQTFLERVREVGMGNFLFTDETKPPEATARIAAEGSEVYAPLNGLWTYPDINQAFKDALGREQMEDWYRKIVQINGLVKYGKTVLSPTTAARNWMSAAFFSIANGHFNWSHMKKSIDGLSEYFTHEGEQAKLNYLRELKQLGVVYDTPYAGEMMRLLADTNLADTLMLTRGKLKIKQAAELATKFYQFGDDFWKIIGFENEKRMWMDAGLTEQAAKERAAERIRNTYPTYSMVGRGIQSLRRFPLAGSFVSFPAEIIRTSANMLRYLAEDYKTEATRPMAIRRAAGLAIASGFAYAAQAISMAMLGYDDDDEEAVRQMAAPWQRNSNLLFTGRDENGNMRFLDMSFLDPYNYWKRPLVAITRGQPFEDAMRDVAKEMVTPFFGVDILAGNLFEILANKKESGAPVYRDHDDALSQLADITNHMRKTLQPGIVSNLERTYKAINGDVSPTGRKYDVEDEAAGWIGFRMSTLDAKVALYYRSFDFQDAKADAEKHLRDAVREPGKLSAGELRDAYDLTVRLRSQTYQDMILLVQAARRNGVPDGDIAQTLKHSGMSGSDILAIRNGRVPLYRPTPGQMRDQAAKARSTFGAEGARRVMDRYREVVSYAG
jgi:predicted RNA methylase